MLWIKALHIISVVCWFAVLFYLPRLFVYHAMSEDTATKEQFKIMERKLYKGIGLPSMIATLVFGAGLVHFNASYYMSAPWFWIKLVLVFFLIGYHHMCGAYLKKFAADKPVPSHTFFRYFNEVPVVFLVLIVFLVVLKIPGI